MFNGVVRLLTSDIRLPRLRRIFIFLGALDTFSYEYIVRAGMMNVKKKIVEIMRGKRLAIV